MLDNPHRADFHAERIAAQLGHQVELVYLGGGLSHHDSFDMKPDAPSEIRGKYTPIKTNVTGIDSDLLAERAAFLRKDSLLAILMISDENDASLKPAQLNWLPWAYANWINRSRQAHALFCSSDDHSQQQCVT